MEAKTVNIAGEDWPVKLGNMALAKIAKKAGTGGKLQDGLNELQNPTLENLPYYVQSIIANGLRFEDDERKPPSLADIDKALDAGLDLWAKVLEAASGDIEQPGKPDEGN